MKNRLLILSIMLLMSSISWSQIQAAKGITGANVSAIVSKGNIIYIGTTSGQIYSSIDSCKNWKRETMPYPTRYGFSIVTMFVDGNRIFASCGNAGTYFSDDDCKSWTQVNLEKPNTVVTGITTFGSDLFFSTNSSGIYRSSNHGLTLDTLLDPLTRNAGMKDILTGEDGALYTYMTYYGNYLKSVDGSNWETINVPAVPVSLLALQNRILLSSNADLYYSDDNWKTNQKLKLPGLNISARNHLLYKGSSAIFLYNNYGIYRSSDNGLNWTKLNLSRSINKIFQFGSKLIAVSTSGIYGSDDNGDSWEKQDDGLVEMQYLSYSKIENTIVLADKKLGIFISDDKGKNWKNISSNMPFVEINSMVSDNKKNIYVMADRILYASNNFGDTWQVDSLYSVGNVMSMSYFQNHLIFTNSNHQMMSYNIFNHEVVNFVQLQDYESTYAIANKLFAFNSMGLYMTTDTNYAWKNTYPNYGFSGYSPYAMYNENSTILLNYLGLFLVSKDAGLTWTKLNLTGISIKGAVISDKIWYGGGMDVIYSTLDGAKWNASKGYFNNSIAQLNPIFVDDGNLFFTKAADGLFYRSDFVGIDETTKSNDFKIYPNPCSDKLQISAKNTINTSDIALFDLTGKQIYVMPKKEPNNSISIDMIGIQAGIYVLRVNENSYKIVHQ